MKKLLLLLLAIALCTTVIAQDEEEKKEPVIGWETGAGLGFDLSQLLQINPKQGAGQNRIGLGGALSIFGKYTKDRIAWDNSGNWQFGVQKLGNGPLPTGEKIPFQKAIDELRLNSKFGYKISETSKFYYAADLGFLSQITSTWAGTDTVPGFFPFRY